MARCVHCGGHIPFHDSLEGAHQDCRHCGGKTILAKRRPAPKPVASTPPSLVSAPPPAPPRLSLEIWQTKLRSETAYPKVRRHLRFMFSALRILNVVGMAVAVGQAGFYPNEVTFFFAGVVICSAIIFDAIVFAADKFTSVVIDCADNMIFQSRAIEEQQHTRK